jgi:hypothetical protein
MNYLELTTALAEIDEKYRNEDYNPYRIEKRNKLIIQYNKERRQTNEQKI